MTTPQRQIDELILQLIDGVISDEGFGLLKQWVEHDQRAAEYYCRFLNDYAAVKMEIASRLDPSFSAPIDDALDRDLWEALAETEKTAPAIKTKPKVLRTPPQPVQMRPVEKASRKVNKSLLLTAVSSLAAFLMLATYVVLNPRTSPPIVGVLSAAVDARWAGCDKQPEPGHDLRAGMLTLQQGVAEIRLDSGATVILEGPAEVELHSVNSLYLHQGSLVATVRREAIGFVVNTSFGKVLDLGTEFAVRVASDSFSEIHVFQGEVKFYPESGGGSIVLPAGDARSIDSAGRLSAIAPRPEAFVRSHELHWRVLAQEGSDYHRWKAAMFDLHRDPSLRAHYLYEQGPSGEELLLNAAPITGGALNGLLGPDDRNPPTWVQGRWPQKHALRFERDKTQAVLVPAHSALAITGPITLSTWVYFPNETQRGGHLISSRQDNHVNFQFSLFDDQYSLTGQRNRFEFLRFETQNRLWCHSKRFDPQSGQWYHLAVTHDNKEAAFYVNGRLFERKAYKIRPEPVAAEVVIGAMKIQGQYELPAGDFDGIVDELMIFDRCLSDDEIQRIYEAGRPALR
jgi:hypothetical protein